MAKKVSKTKTSKVTAPEKKPVMKSEVKMAGGKKRNMVVTNAGLNFWKPKPGDSIEGEFVEMHTRTGGKYGEKNAKGEKEQRNASIVNVETGEVTHMPSTKVLNDFFGGDGKEKKGLNKGTFVIVTYNGEKLKKGMTKGQKNSTYHDYTTEQEMPVQK